MHKPREMRLSTSVLFLYWAGGLVLGAVPLLSEVPGAPDPELIDGRNGHFLPFSSSDWCEFDDEDACCLAWISLIWSAAAALRNSSSRSLKRPVSSLRRGLMRDLMAGCSPVQIMSYNTCWSAGSSAGHPASRQAARQRCSYCRDVS